MAVQGIGGVFLASRDPEALMMWFESALALRCERQGDGGSVMYAAGDAPAIFGVQKARPDAPAPPAGGVEREPYGRQPMMVNLRVDDIDAIVAAVRAAGSEAEGPEEYDGIGRFAWTRTPDGHDVELWQAPAP